jgi:hypothetical protein
MQALLFLELSHRTGLASVGKRIQPDSPAAASVPSFGKRLIAGKIKMENRV